MRKNRHYFTRASTLQITLALAFASVSAILFASSFFAAPSDLTQDEPVLFAPTVTCGASAIRVEATNSGSNTSYVSLQAAFNAVNAGTHTGVINIGVCSDPLAEPVTGATLNASGSGSASYTSVLITPVGARTISSAINPGTALINLNGADNVTINGLNTGGNSLTLTNTSTSSTAETSTVRFINGATNNLLTNCTIRGSSATTLATAGGTVLFSTSSVAGGNSSNTVSNNNIGPAGANLPTKAITGLGSPSPNNNTLNLVDNNNIFDFFNATAVVSGIAILGDNNNWTVSNNRIYQTAARTFTSSALSYSGITVTSAGNSFTVSGNTIGFGAANGTGTTTISGSSNQFRGINLTSSSTTIPTSVQGNTISGISQTTTSSASTSLSPFHGIFLASGRYDVGTITGNTIGSLTGASTIVISSSAVGGSPNVNGIYDFTSSSNTISNNNIGAITITGSGATMGFRGIVLNASTGATATINNNTIGAGGSGAITDNLSVNSAYAMYGIESTGTVPPILFATGNVIRNFSGKSTADSIIIGCGIFARGKLAANSISQNVIHSLSNDSIAASNFIYGINCEFGSFANVVERNVVHSLTFVSAATTAQLAGIVHGAGTGTYRNNMVRLGIDATGASITSGYQIYGIAEASGTSNVYFNSVYIGGTGVFSAGGTFAFSRSSITSGSRNYLDNIFYNARSNVSGPGSNYAIELNSLSGVTSDRNDLYVSGTGGVIGLDSRVNRRADFGELAGGHTPRRGQYLGQPAV